MLHLFSRLANGYSATVGGGGVNTASGYCATVGGGSSNTASGEAATVGGGDSNTASGDSATVGGGYDNTASGNYSMVPGGYDNTAQGHYSFAAGRNAYAIKQGTFVWADSRGLVFGDGWGPGYANRDGFFVRATGGTYFVSAINGTTGMPTAGVYLTPGANGWNSICDRNLKENFTPVDGRAVLARLAAMPIATWNGIAESPDIRHMGPVAQEFHAAFGLGADDKSINTVDADGVALAAIQGLHGLVLEKEAQLADMTARLDQKDGEIAELNQRLTKLEAAVAALGAPGVENQR